MEETEQKQPQTAEHQEAERKAAQEKVEQVTGKSFEETRQFAREVMEAQAGFDQRNAGQAAKEMKDIDVSKVKELNEKIKNENLAPELIKAGLGPEFLSVGATALEKSAAQMAVHTEQFGEGEQMSQMIHQVDEDHKELSQEQVEQMSPEELKRMSENHPSEQNQSDNTAEQKKAPPKRRLRDRLSNLSRLGQMVRRRLLQRINNRPKN